MIMTEIYKVFIVMHVT